jgi:nitrogen fixation regulatory protein
MSAPARPLTEEAIAPLLPGSLYHQAVAQSALAVAITDPQARILYVNPAFSRITGYQEEELIGQNQSILSYRTTPVLVYESMWAQLQRRQPWHGLLVNRRKDGSRYLADLTITPVIDHQGAISHFLGQHRDVSEMYALERQVINQKAFIESVVDSARVNILVIDTQGEIILDNHEYKRLTTDLGQPPMPIIRQALEKQIGHGWLEQQRNFGPIDLAITTPRTSQRWFAASGQWMTEDEASAESIFHPVKRHYLLMTLQEITSLKTQQEQIRLGAMRALLAEQERIQGLRETLTGAIYQMESPFNLLAAALRMQEMRTDIVHNGTNITPPWIDTLSQALRSGHDALATLRGCVPSEIDEPIVPVAMNELLIDLLRLVTPRLLATSIVVERQLATDLPLLHGRQRQLTHLFKQLIDNAIEAIQEARPNRREITLTTRHHDNFLQIEITDSGHGIPKSWQLKVFEPFFTTKGADQHHIGMGLTMAQEIAVQHHGLIEITTPDEGGCRFTITLPYTP